MKNGKELVVEGYETCINCKGTYTVPTFSAVVQDVIITSDSVFFAGTMLSYEPFSELDFLFAWCTTECFAKWVARAVVERGDVPES